MTFASPFAGVLTDRGIAVEFIDVVPKCASGKILRRDLRGR